MIEQIEERSLQSKARLAGGLYLLIIICGLFVVGYIPAALFVSGDAATTVQNIVENETLYRIGLAVHVIVVLSNVPLAVVFYDLFKLANKSFARMVILFILMGATIESVNILFKFMPLVVMQGGEAWFAPGQLQAQAYFPLQLHDIGFVLSLAFVGCYCLVAGTLIYRLRFLPRVTGLLLAFGGICYLVHGFVYFTAPAFAATLFPFIMLPSFVGEMALCLSLLIKGVNLIPFEKGIVGMQPAG